MQKLALGIVPALLVAFAVGCGPSSESGATTADGGVPTADGGAPGDAAPGSDGGPAATCTVLGTNVIANDAKELSNLSVAGNALVFLSSDLGLTAVPSIEKVQQDGTGRTTLYTPTGDRRVHGLIVAGDKVIFLEVDNAAVIPVDEVWTLPLAGGTPTRLGTATFENGRLIGADATHVYLSNGTISPVGTRFERMDLVSGVLENVAISTDRGTAGQVTISGNDIFFIAGTVGSAAGMSDIFKFDKNASGVTPTMLPGGTDALCDSRLGGLWATPTKLGCGFAGLKAATRDGAAASVLVPHQFLLPSNVLVGSDAETFYVLDRTKANTGGGMLSKVASTGGAVTPVACDLNTVENRLADAVFPIQTEYEVVIGATNAFWVEKQGVGAATKWFVRRAAK